MTLRERVLGRKLDPMQAATRQHMALVAFLAWVGLGADGLSSACYGPAEAFLALGEHPHLALYLALSTAATVFVISLAYNQVIDLFPSGGGGYKAATQLIGPYAGLVSGAALIVDYVLTIAISAASGMDALFSLFPPTWQEWELAAGLGAVTLLLLLNLRGMKESITVLIPIFLGFFLSHAALIVYGVSVHGAALDTLWPRTVAETRSVAGDAGWFFVLALFLRAFSVGSGTYTGIEAVSNSVNMLAEPRVRTGHWTMFYMAASLAFTAGGVILLYLLWDAAPVEGQTLNAVVFHSVLANLGWSGDTTQAALVAVLATEAGLLLVASNTGFLGGPAVLASMASDRWVPRQFRQLSSRLVTQNGVLVMGALALLILYATRGDVSLLVVLYSINVFITFSLTLFGLCRHWWDQRHFVLDWKGSFALSALGFVVTAGILLILLAEKFTQGGWVTLLLTGAVIAVCLAIRRHYDATARQVERLDERHDLRRSWDDVAPIAPDPARPTAVLLVGASRGAGLHVLDWVQQRFGKDRFRNYVFVSVGEVDKDAFSSERALKSLQARLDNSLHFFTAYCHSQGYGSEAVRTFGADPLAELRALLRQVLARYPDAMCFAAKLILPRETPWTRLLHNQMPLAMQRDLREDGHDLVIVPIQVTDAAPAGPKPPAYSIS